MSTLDVFLGGEGRNELGSRSGHPAHQNDERPGVIAGLLRRCQADGWRVVGALQWKDIRKLRAKGRTPTEERNVLALVYEAKRANADVVAFVRDADDDATRAEVIDRALETARDAFPEVSVIGGTAAPVLEGWMLALLGTQGTEALGKSAAKTKLRQRGVPEKDTTAMVKLVAGAVLEQVPADAAGLRRWLGTATETLSRPLAP